MLGRKNYTKEEIDNGRAAIAKELAAHDRLRAAATASGAAEVQAAVDEVERLVYNDLVFVLDRYYVHRVRPVSGKDTNPITEVELLTEALMNHGGVLHEQKAVKYVPEQAVLQLQVGDPIQLTAEQFARLSSAFFAELEVRFLDS